MQVFDFAERAYSSGDPVVCSITGRMMERRDAHVDHSCPTFLELAEEFAALQGGWDTMLVVRADGSIGVQLGIEDQAKLWRDFHRENACLRMVSIEANLSLLRRGVKRNS